MDLEQILKIPVNIPLSVLKCPSWPDITNISTQLSSKTIISLIFPMRLNAYSSLKLPILSCLMILAQIYLSFSLFLECTHLTTTPPPVNRLAFRPKLCFSSTATVFHQSDQNPWRQDLRSCLHSVCQRTVVLKKRERQFCRKNGRKRGKHEELVPCSSIDLQAF